MPTSPVNRRKFLFGLSIALPVGAALLDGGLIQGVEAQTQAPAALPRLSLTDPSAIALLYVEDAAKVDKKNPMAARFAPGQNCATCSQLQGKAGEAYRVCAIFPGHLVSAKGWCSVWAKTI